VAHSTWIKKYQVHARQISTGDNPVAPMAVLFSGFLVLAVLVSFGFTFKFHAIGS